MARLNALAGVDAGRQWELAGDDIDIGRDSRSQVRLHDTEASRTHARIVADGAGHRVRDAGSANGVFVNNRPVSDAPLASGDRIQIGQTVLLYTVGDPPPNDLADRIRLLTGEGGFASAIRQRVGETEGSRILALPDEERSPLVRARLRNLNVLYEASRAVSHILDVDSLLGRILELMAQAVRAERFCVLLADTETGRLELKAHRGRGDVAFSTSIAEYVLRERQGVLVEDARLDGRFAANQSIARLGIREAICVPLKGRRESLGVVYLDSTVSDSAGERLTRDHLELASALAHQAALAIEETRYYHAMLQAERLAAVGQAMASLSHHIKNILQGLQSGSDILTMGLADHSEDGVRAGWRILEKNQRKIYDLVLEMLSYSKEREPGCDPVDLGELLAEIAELIAGRAAERGVPVVVECEPGLPPVPADREGVHRAVLNLAGNAVDACDADARVTLRVAVRDDMAAVVVEDTGSGIDPAKLADIFKPFVSTKGAKGTGLGLAVSRKIAREHGGELTASSTPGVGSTFTLTLPRERATPVAPLVAPEAD